MRGHHPGGMDTLMGLGLGITVTAAIVLIFVALYWFLWPSLVGEA